ncbi:hypothetical protein C0Q70_12059 [Pomacea canaliculata]|uniref:Uncharacterized protein n=2 Tax=Pomacea canaliculata TaxID=400727 RepID=A0A2T7P0G6_POMCA|nr:hypothetical protein C0Q70_12059 [Pomacea canaliculata]
MLMTQTSSEMTTKTCLDLQLTSGSGDNVVEENDKGDAHIDFVLSDSCEGSLGRTVVKLATQEAGRAVDFCTIVFNNNTCTVTDLSTGCSCLTRAHYYSVSWKSKPSDESLILKVTKMSTREEKVIFFNKTGIPAYHTKDTPIKKLRPSEILGICSGIIVAVVVAAVLIRKWSSGGSCARQPQGPAKQDREVSPSSVAVRQPKQNTGSSSGPQVQEDIQTRPGSLAPPGSHEVEDNKVLSVIYTIPKRKTRVYSHIVLSSDDVTRSQEEVYNHTKQLTHTTPQSQTEVCSNIVTSNDMAISIEAPVYSSVIPSSTHTSSRRQTPPDDTLTTNYAQIRRHTMQSTKKEKRWAEQVYNHATYTNKGSKGLAEVKFTVVPSKMSSPINPAQVCNNTLPSSCTGIRSPSQVYNHILPYNYLSHRSQAHKSNQTIQYSGVRMEEQKDSQTLSLSQRDADTREPVQSDIYDQTVFTPSRRRQVVHTVYDHIAY